MGKWLAKFSADIPESRTDKADTVGGRGTMSGMAVREREVSAKIIPSQLTDEPPIPPLQPGWRIVYMDHQWKLAGGHDDPDHGMVAECRWTCRGLDRSPHRWAGDALEPYPVGRGTGLQGAAYWGVDRARAWL